MMERESKKSTGITASNMVEVIEFDTIILHLILMWYHVTKRLYYMALFFPYIKFCEICYLVKWILI